MTNSKKETVCGRIMSSCHNPKKVNTHAALAINNDPQRFQVRRSNNDIVSVRRSEFTS